MYIREQGRAFQGGTRDRALCFRLCFSFVLCL